MRTFIFFFAIFVIFTASVFAQNAGLNIIPQPKSVTRQKGEFKLNLKTKIVATDDEGRKSAGILNDLLMKNYGFKLEYTDKPQKKNAIVFISKGYPITAMPPEGYSLELTADDGAALWIDGEKLVNNDGVKEKFASQSAIIPLQKGYHRIVLRYFKGPGKWSLGLRWGIKGQALRFFSANELFRPNVTDR